MITAVIVVGVRDYLKKKKKLKRETVGIGKISAVGMRMSKLKALKTAKELGIDISKYGRFATVTDIKKDITSKIRENEKKVQEGKMRKARKIAREMKEEEELFEKIVQKAVKEGEEKVKRKYGEREREIIREKEEMAKEFEKIKAKAKNGKKLTREELNFFRKYYSRMAGTPSEKKSLERRVKNIEKRINKLISEEKNKGVKGDIFAQLLKQGKISEEEINLLNEYYQQAGGAKFITRVNVAPELKDMIYSGKAAKITGRVPEVNIEDFEIRKGERIIFHPMQQPMMAKLKNLVEKRDSLKERKQALKEQIKKLEEFGRYSDLEIAKKKLDEVEARIDEMKEEIKYYHKLAEEEEKEFERRKKEELRKEKEKLKKEREKELQRQAMLRKKQQIKETNEKIKKIKEELKVLRSPRKRIEMRIKEGDINQRIRELENKLREEKKILEELQKA